MRLLVTRPEADAEHTVSALLARGHSAICAPMLVLEPLADAVIGAGPWDGILFTSANAVAAAIDHVRFKTLLSSPAFAVGRRTMYAAERAGFAEVACAEGNEAALVALLRAKFTGQPARFLYLAAQDQAHDLAGDLRARGFAVETVVIYRAAAVQGLGAEVEAALAAGAIDGVLHYSRRTAEAFLAAAGRAGLAAQARDLRHFCLSDRVAAPLKTAGALRIAVASHPNEGSLLDLLR